MIDIIMKYYSVIQRRKIPPFVIIWIKFEVIILSEICHRQISVTCVISKNPSNLKKQSAECWMLVVRDLMVGEIVGYWSRSTNFQN